MNPAAVHPDAAKPSDLWDLALNRQQIDPHNLSVAIERQASEPSLDFRTRLLIRDAITALEHSWTTQQVSTWLASCISRENISNIRSSDLGVPGFPSLINRGMETTKSETVLQFLRELGSSLQQNTRIEIGGSIALMLAARLSRRTEDIVVVDEVPPSLRSNHQLLQNLAIRYGLHLTHFQSHFLPSGWRSRLSSLGTFGRLEAFLVDPADVYLSKLFFPAQWDPKLGIHVT